MLVPSSFKLLLVLLVSLSSLAGSLASAHPVSLSSSIVQVETNRTLVEVEILVEDLVLHHSLKAQDSRYAFGELTKAAAKHAAFVSKYLLLIGDGKRLKPTSAKIKRAQLDLGGVATTDVKKRMVVYELVYPSARTMRFLTIDHSLGGENALVPALMDCMVLHSGGIVEASEQITAGRPFTVELDWKNPPPKERSWRELRDQKKKQTARRLGIASYSGIYSFLYIERNEVRHEVLIPLLTLKEWIKLRHVKKDSINPKEQLAAGKQIAEKLRTGSGIKINGRIQEPLVDRIQFFGLDIRDFALNAPAREVNVYQARVGVILRYPTMNIPKKVELNWELFSERASYLRTRLLPQQHASRDVTLNRDRAKIEWQPRSEERFVEQKLKAIRIDQAEPHSIIEAMIGGLYVAQEARTDEEIYDRLTTLVSPELARPLFLHMNRTLIIAEQGGAKARIRRVQLKNLKLTETRDRALAGLASWEVEGTVEHWGHIHTRRHLHAARIRLQAGQSSWKLVEFETQSFKQLESRLTVRK